MGRSLVRVWVRGGCDLRLSEGPPPKRIPALRDVTDDDKPAFYLRRLRDGLGTVEAIHGIAVSRKNRTHTVDVKWLHADTDVSYHI